MTFRVIEKYVHPLTKAPLIIDDCGNLRSANNSKDMVYENDNGTYDFATKEAREGEEREYYDNLYTGSSPRSISIETCEKMWKTNHVFRELLSSMEDIAGKKILLLGNGVEIKELYFLCLGARCVYTDLSVESVKYIKTMFGKSEFKRSGFDNIEFHAVDACHLPFPDESFDIIYGFAFVHHIKNLDTLFSEIGRCLKTEGICRFMDHAYSPLWQTLKDTVLKPLQRYSHRKHGISPADAVATERGGYKCEELERIKEACGFREMLYVRKTFFEKH